MFATNALFVNAISHLAWIDEFNASAFCRKVQSNPTMLFKCATRDLYVEMLDDFHNFGMRMDSRVSLKILAKQAASKRNVAMK